MIPILRRSATRAGAVAALCGGMLAVTFALGGCTPGTDPKPTPTPLFTSEADAYKAAEKVYREYVDALNGRNAGDADARPDKYLGGKALEFDTESVRTRKEQGIRVSGSTLVRSFSGVDALLQPPTAVIHADVCIDVSGTKLVNSEEQDVTPADRKAAVQLRVALTQSKLGLIITDSTMAEDQC